MKEDDRGMEEVYVCLLLRDEYDMNHERCGAPSYLCVSFVCEDAWNEDI